MATIASSEYTDENVEFTNCLREMGLTDIEIQEVYGKLNDKRTYEEKRSEEIMRMY